MAVRRAAPAGRRADAPRELRPDHRRRCAAEQRCSGHPGQELNDQCTKTGAGLLREQGAQGWHLSYSEYHRFLLDA